MFTELIHYDEIKHMNLVFVTNVNACIKHQNVHCLKANQGDLIK